MPVIINIIPKAGCLKMHSMVDHSQWTKVDSGEKTHSDDIGGLLVGEPRCEIGKDLLQAV